MYQWMVDHLCLLPSLHLAGYREVANVGRISAEELWARFEMHTVAGKLADSGHTYMAADILFRAYRRRDWEGLMVLKKGWS
jgi:hypothetical protein